MKRTVWLEETKQMRFEEAYRGWIVRRLTQEEAAQLLGGCVPGPSGVTSTVMRTAARPSCRAHPR